MNAQIIFLRHENHIKTFSGNQKSESIGSTSIFSCKQQSDNQPRFSNRHRIPTQIYGLNSWEGGCSNKNYLLNFLL